MTLFKVRLKQLRKDNNMTQKKLADLLGVSKSTISSYETGSTYPSFDKLFRLANIFNVSLDYFYINMEAYKTNYINGTRVAVISDIPYGLDISAELANISDKTPLNILCYRTISPEYQQNHKEYFIFSDKNIYYIIHIQSDFSAGDTVLACEDGKSAQMYYAVKDGASLTLIDSNNNKLCANVHIIGIAAEATNEY